MNCEGILIKVHKIIKPEFFIKENISNISKETLLNIFSIKFVFYSY